MFYFVDSIVRGSGERVQDGAHASMEDDWVRFLSLCDPTGTLRSDP